MNEIFMLKKKRICLMFHFQRKNFWVIFLTIQIVIVLNSLQSTTPLLTHLPQAHFSIWIFSRSSLDQLRIRYGEMRIGDI